MRTLAVFMGFLLLVAGLYGIRAEEDPYPEGIPLTLFPLIFCFISSTLGCLCLGPIPLLCNVMILSASLCMDLVYMPTELFCGGFTSLTDGMFKIADIFSTYGLAGCSLILAYLTDKICWVCFRNDWDTFENQKEVVSKELEKTQQKTTSLGVI